MSKELVISSNAHETKVAVLEEDQLVEIYFQRANEYSLAGSIHKGRVTRVLPGMQSAFVDLGLERDTFLYVSDFFEENGEDFDRVEERPSGRGGRPDKAERPERGARFERQDRSDKSDRGERPERQERTERTERSERLEQPPPPANLIQAPVEAPFLSRDREGAGPAPPELPAAAEPEARPPAIERVEDDGRDRRGRRSRRRRSRGRGFPDSKYASDLTGAPERDFDSEPEPAEPEEAAEVFLLPGESLAKYRRPSSEPRSAAEELDDEQLETAGEEIDLSIHPQHDEALIPELAAELESSEVEDPEEIAQQTESAAASAAPELAIDEPTVAEPAGDAAEPDSEPEIELTAEPDTEETTEAPDYEISPEDDFGTDDLSELLADSSDDAEPELVDFSSPDEVPDEESEDPRVEVVSEEQQASASVREQSGRYQHRQSRRMRRKQRGDSRGDSKTETRGDSRSEPRGESRGEQPREPQVAAEPEVRGARSSEKAPLPSISDLLREGQEIIVQIAKEPLGQKGARITSHIALPGRFVVFMPTLEHLGVSRKIASDEERLRLKKILQNSRTGITGGFIVRTAGEGRSEEEIASDMSYLYNLWLDIRSKAEKRKAPVLLHHDLDIVQRILRDQLSDMFKAIWIDNEDVYESVLRFMQRFQPGLVSRVKMYTRPAPIFDSFGVTQEIEKALRPKVWLKSGGYIVINQTEALVAIDVNTGKYVGKSNRLEDTITRTNTEAVKEIVRQIRLRDLGGIIVIDFIDMDERKNRQKVMQALEEAMRVDRAPYKILQFNDFGLVAITRKRVKQSLERSLCSPCPVCDGAGYTKSVATVVGEIIQEATKIRGNVEGKNVVLRVYPEVARFLKSNTNDQLEEIESILGRPVMVMSDAMLNPEKFDMAW